MKKLFLILISAAFAPSLLLWGGEPAHPKAERLAGNQASMTMTFGITTTGKTPSLTFTVLLPKSVPGQQNIREITYTPTPDEFFEMEGQPYARFRLKSLAPRTVITIQIDADVYRCDYETLKSEEKNRQLAKADELKPWLLHEQYLEKDDPAIQKFAKTQSNPDPDLTIQNCFDFVVKKMNRANYDPKDNGAVWALRKRKGDCTEFADLFIALCRANGLPARYCEGYVLTNNFDTPAHDWAEVYSEKYGWIPFDPFHAFLKLDTTFSERQPIYLLLEHNRRNATLNNYHYWAYDYVGSGSVSVHDEFRVKKLARLKK